jgi:hypothetical protein
VRLATHSDVILAAAVLDRQSSSKRRRSLMLRRKRRRLLRPNNPPHYLSLSIPSMHRLSKNHPNIQLLLHLSNSIERNHHPNPTQLLTILLIINAQKCG